MNTSRTDLITKIILGTATLKDFSAIGGTRDDLIDFLVSPDTKEVLSSFGLITSRQPASFFIYEKTNPNSYRYLIPQRKGSTPKLDIFTEGYIPLK